MIQTRNDLKHYLQEDYQVNLGYLSHRQIVKQRIKDIGDWSAWRFLRALRHLEYYINNAHRSPLHRLLCGYWRLQHIHLSRRYRLDIPPFTTGYGLRLSHLNCGGIVISNCTIGNYLNIRQFTTIGSKGDIRYDQQPVLGDHIFLGSNVCIIGKVHIGDHTVIGAGSVVTKDIPPHSIAAGNPCRIISSNDNQKQ